MWTRVHTYGEVNAIFTYVSVATRHGYTLGFAQEFNERRSALEDALALQQGVDWRQEPLDVLLVVKADTLLGTEAEKLFRQLCEWLVEQGFSLEKSA